MSTCHDHFAWFTPGHAQRGAAKEIRPLGLSESRTHEPPIVRLQMPHDMPAHRGPAGLRITPRQCYECRQYFILDQSLATP